MILQSLLRGTTALVQSLEPGQSLCILAARLMHDWLTDNGIPSAVLPCRVTIWNDVLMERGGGYVSIGYGYPDDLRAAFGYHTRRDSYNGHLVVRVGDLILDPTLGQASDPARRIVAGPLLARVDRPGFFAGVTHFADTFRWGAHPALRVAYEAQPSDLTYRRTYHWNDPTRRELGGVLSTRVLRLPGPSSEESPCA